MENIYYRYAIVAYYLAYYVRNKDGVPPPLYKHKARDIKVGRGGDLTKNPYPIGITDLICIAFQTQDK